VKAKLPGNIVEDFDMKNIGVNIFCVMNFSCF